MSYEPNPLRNQPKVHERFATEEHQGDRFVITRISQEKVDAFSCRLLTHEAFGSAIVTLGSKTVGAAEIAIIGNVEDKAALRKGTRGKLRQRWNGLRE